MLILIHQDIFQFKNTNLSSKDPPPPPADQEKGDGGERDRREGNERRIESQDVNGRGHVRARKKERESRDCSEMTGL